MALFTVTDYDREVYEKELKDFLPDHLFDVHAHIFYQYMKFQPATGASKRNVSWPSRVAKDNPVEDLIETYKLMFPDKKVEALMFSSGGPKEDRNEYVMESMKKTGWPGLYYSHPEQTGEEIREKIISGGFIGTKSYLSLSPKYIPTNEIRIFDFFPPHQLKVLDEMGAVLMLHIPRNDRLRDPVNLAQIIELRQKFPNIRLIIAHIGRAYCEYDVGDAFEVLDKTGIQYTWDFTANCCEYAITECIRHAGPKNVMFGTDMPILRMRTRRIEENNTYVNLVPKGLYGDVSGDKHMREVSDEEAKTITFFAYEELLAFKRACKTLGCTKQDVEDMLCNNAVKICEEARKSIYGK